MPGPAPLFTQLTTESIRRVSSGSNAATAPHARRRADCELWEVRDDDGGDDDRADVERNMNLSPSAPPEVGGDEQCCVLEPKEIGAVAGSSCRENGEGRGAGGRMHLLIYNPRSRAGLRAVTSQAGIGTARTAAREGR